MYYVPATDFIILTTRDFSMMQVINDFLRYLQADRGYSPRTVATYRESLTSFEVFFRSLDSQLSWESLDADVVRQWMATEMQRGKNARTVVKDLAAVRSLYKYLLRMQCIEFDPVRLVKNPKIHMPLPTFLKQSEIDNLFDDVTFPDNIEGSRDRAILLTFYHTGIRVSELTGLRITDVDFLQGELRVTGKRNKQRIVPFGHELGDSLRCYLMQRPAETTFPANPLFVGAQGKSITPSQVRAIVKRYLSLVTTQKKKSPHVLRHTFATVMLNNGADLEAIKELLGHQSITTTEVYTHTTFADLKKEYERAHPRA